MPAVDIVPVLNALRSHRQATALIALEIALVCAVFCNACFMISGRLRTMHIDSGVDEPALATLQLDGFEDADAVDLNARMLSGLRAIPGVQSASALNSIPFGARRGTVGISLDPAGEHFGGVVELYLAGPGSVQALGVHIVAGRALQDDDYQPFTDVMPRQASVLITQALARHLWPGEVPLGRTFWVDRSQFRVAGVIAHLVVPDPGAQGNASADWSAVVPAIPGRYLSGSYLLRAQPSALPRVLEQARRAAAQLAPEAVVDEDASQMLRTLRAAYFHDDRAMIVLLLGVIVALLLVSALGIVGLASFWVQQRRRQIGIRRAIGATRGDILRYFQVENFLIVSFGIALGVILSYGLNLLLMSRYEVERLPFGYLLEAAGLLWSLGQLAVLGPALRAASVPPATATRSV